MSWILLLACDSSGSAPPAPPPNVPLSSSAFVTMPLIGRVDLAWPQDSQPVSGVRLAVLPNGSFAILDPRGGSPFITIRDSTGTLIARTGRQGEGPGELTGMGQLLAQGREFLVLDDGRAAAVRFSSTDGDSPGESPLRVPGFALAAVGDSLDIFDGEFAYRQAAPEVKRLAIGGTGDRAVLTESDSIFRHALGLPLASAHPIPPPGWYADPSITIWGDGSRYNIGALRSGDSDTLHITRHLAPNYRGPLGTAMMRAVLEKLPARVRAPDGRNIAPPNTAARLDTLDREVVPYFGASGLGTDAAGRILVAGAAGDSSFIDVFAGEQFLGRFTLDCFTPASMAINRGWVLIQCRDRVEDDRTYTIQLYRVHENPTP